MTLLMDVQTITDFKFYIEHFWYYFSLANMVPLLCVMVHKMWNPINWHDEYLSYKRTADDKYVWLFSQIAVLYYILDTIYLIIRQAWLEMCPFAFLTHHIIFLAFSKWCNNPKYFTWFHTAVPAWHNLLIVFPEYFSLSVIYVGILIINHIGFYMSPFRNYFNPYGYLRIGYYILYLAILFMAIGGCENTVFPYEVYWKIHVALKG